MMNRTSLSPVAFLIAGAALSCSVQSLSGQAAAIPKPLAPYTSCVFPDMLRIVEVDPLAPGVTARAVDTAQGSEQIDVAAGERVMFAYPMTDFFAHLNVELLAADRYPQLKQALIANLHYLESQPHGPTRAEALPAGLHGFEVHGNDRLRLEGDVLGMYLMFDDKAHVATTIYFLNQQSWQRKFQTMDEYGRLRDHFLQNYTACIRQNQALER